MFSPLECRLAFQFIPGLGAGSYWQFVEHFGAIDLVFKDGLSALKHAASEEGRTKLAELERFAENSALYEEIQSEIERCQALGICLLGDDHPDYPTLLRQTKRCPPILYVKGDPAILSTPQIAVVGSRSPSPVGQALAFEFARDLASAGFAITSGLALGIDACAHRGALDSAHDDGAPTIAVLGSGLARVYPKRNRRLAEEIIDSGGALVSEFAMETEALPANFPQRNRVVSGLSCGTLVVEAALKSGSLITARYALQQDREVFAIPGSIRSSVSRGCHAMIKSGAKLVETPMDIICELESLVQYHRDLAQQGRFDKQADDEPFIRSLLGAVGYEPTSLDQIADRAVLPLEQLLPTLLQLELDGRIENTGLGYVRLQ